MQKKIITVGSLEDYPPLEKNIPVLKKKIEEPVEEVSNSLQNIL